MPSPYGRQRPRRTSARSPSRARASSTSRDFPIPASPSTVTSLHERSATTSSNADRIDTSSRSRPTMGASSRRVCGSAPGIRVTSRWAETGSVFPRAGTGSTGSITTASRTSRYVASPISTSPGAAACSSRAATFTASPVTSAWPAEGSPAITSPVLTPIRGTISTPNSTTSSAFSSVSRLRISAAARTARSASSSCSCGMPNTAMIASPMNFSTAPPCRSTTARIASK